MESAIVNLRAELHRKKSAANKITPEEFRLRQKLKPRFKDSTKLKKDSLHKGQDNNLCTDEEASKLEKSRQALEKKAALYDQLKCGTEVLEDDELNQKFLVDFQEKIHKEVSDVKKEREKKQDAAETSHREDSDTYKAKDASEEWVEYVDGFGRTRVCQRKDVEYLETQMGKEEESTTQQSKRSRFHDRWEQIQEQTSQKQDVHYQDVLYDEARLHGTGFMPFSRDETERAAQQQFLKDLGSEAEKAAVSKEALNRKRQKMMQERLTKVRQRKRLKMGLPIKDDTLKTPPPSDEEDVGADEAPLPMKTSPPPQMEEKEPVRVREWDLGKPGVGSILTQEQWIESRRKMRDNEFAPPSIYDRGTPSASFRYRPSPVVEKEGETSVPASKTSSGYEAGRNRGASEVAPPTSYDYYRPSTTSKKSFSLGRRPDVEAAISRGLAQLRKEQDQSESRT